MKRLSLLLLLSALSLHAVAAKPFKTNSIVLLQPTGLLAQRVETTALSAYINALEASTGDHARSMGDKTPRSGFIVFATRPDKTRKIWLDFKPALSATDANALITRLEAVGPCVVRGGTVVAAFSVNLWGGNGSAQAMPTPPEWNEFVADKKSVEVTQLVDSLWPPVNPVVSDLVTQILEPTGGKISRPKDWFYAELHRGPVYDWTISREDTDHGNKPYVTGVRIQMFTGVKEGAGKSPEQLIRDFIDNKKREAEKILSTCEPQKQDFFTRICMETEEGPFHISYAMFWANNDGDIAVVVISGTNKELWTTYGPVFNEMGNFELMDPKRFE